MKLPSPFGMLVILVAAILCVAGCEMIAEINFERYRAFHVSRWEVITKAYATHGSAITFPAKPTPPSRCGPELDAAYLSILAAGQAENQAWVDLLQECALDVEFCSKALDAVVNRDAAKISKLAPEIDNFVATYLLRRGEWLGSRQADVAVKEVIAEWELIWPGSDLDFDLSAGAQRARLALMPPLDELRTIDLTNYYRNEYDRLAFIYLGYEPDSPPGSISDVPEGCSGLASALVRLEAALLVRAALDEALEADVARVVELTNIDPTETPWDEITIPRSRYAAPRAKAAIARLQLLTYIDELLTAGLDIYLYDVDRHWGNVWPGHGLKTNIYDYASLGSTERQLADPMATLTFRH